VRDNGAGSLTVAVQLRYRTASVSDRLLLFFHDPSPFMSRLGFASMLLACD
jgi:hypothetical protein